MKKLITPYDNEIAKLETDIGNLKEELSVLRQRRVNFLCPFKIGVTLVNNKGKKAEVTGIYPSFGKDYRIKGRYILKNGGLGLAIHTLYDWDGWK